MNYIFKLFLPVAASAMMWGQVSTAQAAENHGGKGGGGHSGGGAARTHSGGGGSHGTAVRSNSGYRSTATHSTSAHRSTAATTRSTAATTRSMATTSRSSVARTSNGTSVSHGNSSLALTTNGGNAAGLRSQARVAPGMGGVDPSTTIASRQFAYRAGNFQPGWNPGRTYTWNNYNWNCYNGIWAVAGIGWPFNWYSYPYPFWYNNWIYYNGDAYQPGGQTAVIGGGTSIVTSVQQDLANQGYNPGPMDGVVGPRTSSAISAYQRDHGMPPTGQINGTLLNSLGL